jgi:hypothetical protein
MGFVDLFRPKWRHSDEEVRAEAVRMLGADEISILERVARQDPSPRIRKLAFKKIEDPELLDVLARDEADEGLRKTASEKAIALLVGAAVKKGDEKASLEALSKITQLKAVVEVAKHAAEEAVRRAATNGISDPKALAEVARRADDPGVRRAAIERVTDEEVLREAALHETAKEVGLAAVAKVIDLPTLEMLAQKAKSKAVKEAAKKRVGGAPKKKEEAAVEASPEAKRRARRVQLCVTVEKAASSDDLDAAEAKVAEARAAWIEIGSADDELQKRFEKAGKKLEEKRAEANARVQARVAAEESRQAEEREAAARRAAATEAEKEAAPVEKPEPKPEKKIDPAAQRARLEAICTEAEALYGAPKVVEKAFRSLEREFASLESAADDALRDRLKQVGDRLAAVRAQEQAAREAERAAAQAKLAEIATNVESLVETDDLKRAESTLKSANDAFANADIPRGEAGELRARFQAARDKLAGRIQELRDAEGWKRWANVPMLEALCTKVEAMITVAVEEKDGLKDLAAKLKAVQAEWKTVGPAPREKSEALWNRFKTAADKVHERCQEHFAVLDEERKANLSKKEQLCVAVEGLASSTDWKQTAEAVKKLQEEWKQVGPVPKDQSDAIWKRFRAACDQFFNARKEAGATFAEEKKDNLARKEELCAAVEELSGSSDWKNAADRIKGYQSEWKKIGPVDKSQSDAIWKRFRDACDKFFARRQEHFAKGDEERTENLAKKVALCEKAEALVGGEDREAAQKEAKKLQADWKRVGAAPRDKADEIWRRFRDACDKIFAAEEMEEAEEEAAPAAPEGEVGIGGFVNRLPLEGIAAKLREPAEEKRAAPVEKKAAPVEKPVEKKAEKVAPAPAPVVEKRAEPVVEKKAEPIVEKKAEPVVEKKAEPIVEKKAEPVVEKKAEPVVEKKAEPVVGKNPEPVATSAVDAGWGEIADEVAAPAPTKTEKPASPSTDVDAGWGDIDLGDKKK